LEEHLTTLKIEETEKRDGIGSSTGSAYKLFLLFYAKARKRGACVRRELKALGRKEGMILSVSGGP